MPMRLSKVKTGAFSSLSSTQLRILVGCFLINLPTGLLFGFGNMYPYLYSYVRFAMPGTTSGWDLDPAWLFPGILVFRSISVTLSNQIKHRVGLRNGMLVGVVLYSSSFFLTYAAFHHTVWMTFVTFAVVNGFAKGLTLSFFLTYLTSHFDKNVGVATAVASCSAGVGCIILNFLVTAYVNPDNLSTDVKENGFTFFSQRVIVERAPMIWVIVGIVTSLCTGLGYCLVAYRTCGSKNTSSKDEDARTVNTGNTNLDEGQRIQSSGCQPQTYNTYSTDAISQGSSSYRLQDDALPSNGGAESCSHDHAQVEASSTLPKKDKTLKEALQSASFYALVLYSGFLTFPQLITINYYKMLGQLWISNDWFLTLTGNVSAVFLIGVRLSLGRLVDAYGVKNTLISVCSSLCAMLVLWYFTPMLNPWLFLVWTDLMMAVNANNVVLLPLATLKSFGSSNYIVLFGLLQMAVIVVNLIFPSLFSFLVNAVGWFWILLVGSGVVFATLLLIIAFLDSDRKGR